MLRRKLYSLGFLISTFVLLVGTVYAWFSLAKETPTDVLELNVKSDVVESFLFVKKNDEAEIFIQNSSDLVALLQMGVPSDNYRFRVLIKSYSSDSKTINVMLKNMTYLGTDIREVYLLKDSKVYFGAEVITLTPNVPGTAIGYDNQILKENRLKNFLNVSNNVVLVNNKTLQPNQTLDIIFDITFDVDTHSSAYAGSLDIEKLSIDIG
ncbi:MAG TPA: hypothetical protein PLP84_04215 [Acholeplasmataceae bacterium]|jgi:hypothetical protein|nr:hypothetical protein [Acholeplasmataceae bacterium]